MVAEVDVAVAVAVSVVGVVVGVVVPAGCVGVGVVPAVVAGVGVAVVPSAVLDDVFEVEFDGESGQGQE